LNSNHINSQKSSQAEKDHAKLNHNTGPEHENTAGKKRKQQLLQLLSTAANRRSKIPITEGEKNRPSQCAQAEGSSPTLTPTKTPRKLTLPMLQLDILIPITNEMNRKTIDVGF
jgi:hypothetical protein